MNEILKRISLAAAPVIVGAVAGPEAGTVTAGALAAGGFTKAAGKANERAGGRPWHKVASPVAAVGAAVGGGQLMSQEALTRLCEAAQSILAILCDHPTLLLALLGVLATGSHQTVSNVHKAVRRRTYGYPEGD